LNRLGPKLQITYLHKNELQHQLRGQGVLFCGQDTGIFFTGLRIGTQNFNHYFLAGHKRLNSFLSAPPCACQNNWKVVPLTGTGQIILFAKNTP
jgi:hypothetical protein